MIYCLKKYGTFFFSSILIRHILFFPATVVNAQEITDTVTTYDSGNQHHTGHTGENANYFLQLDQYPRKKDSLHWRRLPASVVKKMQEDDDFWYANADIKKPGAKQSETPITEQKWFEVILWLIIISGFAGFIMIYLQNSNVWLFNRRNKQLSSTREDEIETDDIFAIHYQKEIDKAVKNGNYRFAIRLQFLRLLRDMSVKKIIQYKQDNTNLDFLMQLNTSSYYNDFFRITRYYEYSWYGQFMISEETYRIISDDMHRFEKSLPYS